MFCPECGEKIDQESVFCPNCGKKVEGVSPIHPPKKKKAWQTVIIGALALFFIGLVIGGYILFFKADPPEKVVIRFIKLAGKGDIIEAHKLLSERGKKRLEKELLASGKSLAEVQKELKKEIRGTVKDIKEIKIENVNIETMAVVRSLVVVNGDEAMRTFVLVKEKGKWRIDEDY